MSAETGQAEKDRALEYVRIHGSESAVEKILGRLSGTFSELNAVLASIDAKSAITRPSPEKWCIQEVADHLLVSHQPGIEQISAMLEEKSPGDEALPLGLQSEDPFAENWPELVAQLIDVHTRFEAVVASASDTVPLTARVPVLMEIKAVNDLGEMTYVRWEERFDWKAFALLVRIHTFEHVQQIQRILKAK